MSAFPVVRAIYNILTLAGYRAELDDHGEIWYDAEDGVMYYDAQEYQTHNIAMALWIALSAKTWGSTDLGVSSNRVNTPYKPIVRLPFSSTQMAIEDTILKQYAEVKARRQSSLSDTSAASIKPQDRMAAVGRSTTPLSIGDRHTEMTIEDLQRMQDQYKQWFEQAEHRVSEARKRLKTLCEDPGHDHVKGPYNHFEKSNT
ncbi:hypothetical protein F5Y16DRAFT_402958 [Xylariaceae sp. FL0255]|nr:hypothetical protein F5Y16DRAFT_402958 [Xylariaceae sp. FL0255]